MRFKGCSSMSLNPVGCLMLQVANDPAHDDVLHHGARPGITRASAMFLLARRTHMDPAGYSVRCVGPSMMWNGSPCARTCQEVSVCL
jgi:hypothetical protein